MHLDDQVVGFVIRGTKLKIDKKDKQLSFGKKWPKTMRRSDAIAFVILLFIPILLVGMGLGILATMTSECDSRYQNGSVRTRSDGIHFDGAVSFQSVAELLTQIDALKDGTPIVWFQSGGGSVDAALYFALMVSDRHIQTRVGKSGFCASSCVPMFLAGAERYADPTAAFGLHAPFCIGNLASLECLAERSYELGRTNYKAYFKAKAPTWFAKTEKDEAFQRTGPDQMLCYTFTDGDLEKPSSQYDHDYSRAACALAPAIAGQMMAQDIPNQSCPVGFWARVSMFLRYLVGLAQTSIRDNLHYTP